MIPIPSLNGLNRPIDFAPEATLHGVVLLDNGSLSVPGMRYVERSPKPAFGGTWIHDTAEELRTNYWSPIGPAGGSSGDTG
jgi:hypothetical protein